MLNVGNGHASLRRLFLRILQHADVLGDAVCLGVVVVHVSAEGDHVNGVEPPVVGIEEGDDLAGRHFCVEGVGILEVIVPHLINDLA